MKEQTITPPFKLSSFQTYICTCRSTWNLWLLILQNGPVKYIVKLETCRDRQSRWRQEHWSKLLTSSSKVKHQIVQCNKEFRWSLHLSRKLTDFNWYKTWKPITDALTETCSTIEKLSNISFKNLNSTIENLTTYKKTRKSRWPSNRRERIKRLKTEWLEQELQSQASSVTFNSKIN